MPDPIDVKALSTATADFSYAELEPWQQAVFAYADRTPGDKTITLADRNFAVSKLSLLDDIQAPDGLLELAEAKANLDYFLDTPGLLNPYVTYDRQLKGELEILRTQLSTLDQTAGQ